MSENHHPEEIDYGKKGSKVMWTFVYFAAFIILLIWVYSRNGDGLPL